MNMQNQESQTTEEVRFNIDYNNTWVLRIQTRGGFLFRLWFLISAPIIWLIKGEIKIK